MTLIEEFDIGPYWSDVPSGWEAIVREVLLRMRAEDPDVRFEQVKEKFAGLRIYVAGDYDKLDPIVREAEKQAEKTCQHCGADQPSDEVQVRGKGWHVRLCAACDAKRQQ